MTALDAPLGFRGERRRRPWDPHHHRLRGLRKCRLFLDLLPERIGVNIGGGDLARHQGLKLLKVRRTERGDRRIKIGLHGREGGPQTADGTSRSAWPAALAALVTP